MTDADTVRVAALFHYDMTGNRDALAALDRLVAERDEALAQNVAATDQIASASDARARLDDRLVAVEAERDRLRAALERRAAGAASNPAHEIAKIAEKWSARKRAQEMESRAVEAEAERDRLREHANRMMAQVDELTEQRIERNAEIVVLRQALERVAREGSPDDASFARAVLDRLVSRGGV